MSGARRGWQKLSRFPGPNVPRNDTSSFTVFLPLHAGFRNKLGHPFLLPSPPQPPLPLSSLSSTPAVTSSTFPYRRCAHVPVCMCVTVYLSLCALAHTCTIGSPGRVKVLRVRGRWHQNGRGRTHGDLKWERMRGMRE